MASGILITASMIWFGASLYSQGQVRDAQNEMQRSQNLLRNHMESDMLHDNIMGNMRGVIVANTTQTLDAKEVATTLRESVTLFRQKIDKTAAYEGAPKVHAAILAAKPDAEAYLAAANEIKTLIGNSTGQVKIGVKLVREAGDLLQCVVGKVTGIATVMDAVSSNASDQASSLKDIDRTARSLDQITQQNAALAEELTDTARQVKTSTQTVSSQIARFKLNGGSLGTSQPSAFDLAA